MRAHLKTSGIYGLTLLAAILCFVLAPMATASAQSWDTPEAERITRFHSHLIVNRDASLTVTETITVIAQGNQIKRGIFRDFPTTYTNKNGSRTRVGFKVDNVTRNGRAEPYTIEGLANGKRIRIGQADVFLAHGQHTYEITYTTTRQLGFFDDFDELYYNVTGTDWAFPIDQVQVAVYIAPSVAVGDVLAFTGAYGDKGTDYRGGSTNSGAWFETTRALQPGEGLTIALNWPKGVIDEPTDTEKLGLYLRDNLGALAAILTVLIVSAYYFYIWSQVGRDPQGGAIFPRYAPPQGLSPAACRYIRRMGYDRKGFTAALINMAVKGYLIIDEGSKPKALERRGEATTDALSPGEKKVAAKLFGTSRTRLELKNKHHSKFSGAISALSTAIKDEYEKGYFIRNTKYWVAGLIVTIIGVLIAGAASLNNPAPLFLAVWLSLWSVGCTFLATTVIDRWRAVLAPGETFTDLAGALFITLFAMPFLVAEIVVFGFFVSMGGFILGLTIVCLGALNFAFYHLLKAPTLAGRRLMDEIEGFRQYLSVAEQPRLDMSSLAMSGPKKTPELFEKYLPYALALDVENQWAEKFSDVLAAASTDPNAKGGYHPAWYHGNRWSSANVAGFSSGLGTSLANSVAAAATAPGSSSGSSGGGFSGGGGGGGGGGGW